MSVNKQEFREQNDLFVDPNLGVAVNRAALSKDQYHLYVARHLHKKQNWVRLDLLPFENFRFGKIWGLTEYYLHSQRLKINYETRRLAMFYSPYFVARHIDTFSDPLIHTSQPYLQSMIFSYYRSREDGNNLVNYMKRILRKLSQYGLSNQAESLGEFVPTEITKKNIKHNMMANAQKNLDKLLEKREKERVKAQAQTQH